MSYFYVAVLKNICISLLISSTKLNQLELHLDHVLLPNMFLNMIKCYTQKFRALLYYLLYKWKGHHSPGHQIKLKSIWKVWLLFGAQSRGFMARHLPSARACA